MMAQWTRLGSLALAITLATSVAAATPIGQATAASARPQTGSSAYDWPEMHRDSMLTGYAANSTISSSNAGSLGARWGTDLYSAILDSPVIAYDPIRDKTLVYVGTDTGGFYALDKATGAIVWADQLSGPIRATPLVSNGSVWVGTALNATVYKLNASTGAVECSQAVPVWVDATPVAATPPGGPASVYFAAYKEVLSISAASCAVQWTFSGQANPSTIWDSLSYAVDAAGKPLLLFGTSDPDNSAYALDAVTGKEVWRYQTTTTGDNDIGSGVTVSPPGANGFADGVAYVPAKNGYVYALDLTTGHKIWQAGLGTYQGTPNESLSTAALVGNNLVVGNAVGAVDLNATTGDTTWSYQTPVNSQLVPPAPSEVVSSPAVSGPAGGQVVTFGDLGGAVRVLSLATGDPLHAYQTGSWITSSPAVSGGDVLIGSSDGFLYDLAAGGGNQRPHAAITSPAQGAVVANPNGSLTVNGTAGDGTGVASVVVAVRQGGVGGMWWDAAASRWSTSLVTVKATLTAPGAITTGWSVRFAVPPSGNAYRIDAYAVSVTGASAVPAVDDEFFVSPVPGSPTLILSGHYAAPGDSVQVHGRGFGSGETVDVTLFGQTLASIKARSDGSLPATPLTLPASTGFGPTALTATGAASGKTTAVSLDVSNNWTQQGNGPDHTGFEPNDPVIDDTVDPGQNILLYPAWHSSLGAGLTSPAVQDQVLYTGDRSGTLHALRVHAGSSIWTWRTPTGAAITGSPAVDAAAGLVLVGAADGTLYALHTGAPSVGKLAWSANIGTGEVLSPVFSGTSVYAATTGGNVEALSTSGSTTWTAHTSSAITAPPALAPGSGVLVVPATTGLSALNATSGGSLWTFPVAGPATPTMSTTTVYVGSSDGNVYALSESTGQKIWSAPTGGAIGDSGALTYNTNGSVKALWIGSNDGNLYAFDAATGQQLNAYGMGGAVTGVSVAGNTALITTSAGSVLAVRTWNRGSVVWTEATGDGAIGQPTLVDGTLFAAGQNGALWAFTPYGEPPM